MGPKYLKTAVEQRSAVRSSVDLPIALSCFQARNDFILFEARACNQSASGLCLQTSQKLCKDMVVFIRALNCDRDSDSTAALLKSAAVGEVRWCHPIKSRQGEHYATGIRYF